MKQETQTIYDNLLKRYKRATISKAELANELSVSTYTIDKYMSRGYGIPEYVKIGKAKNTKVLFPLEKVAEYLSQTIKVA